MRARPPFISPNILIIAAQICGDDSMTDKTGILLINLGTPDEATKPDVRRYLLEFLTDWRVIDKPWLTRQLLVRGIIVPFRTANSTELYQRLWTEKGSPLKFYGDQLVAELEKLVGPDVPVALGMRYQKPSILSALDQLLAQDVSHLIVFPLFPHYASASTGSAHQELLECLYERQVIPSLTLIQDYYAHPAFLDVIIAHSQAFDLDSYDHILFSYHGLPESQLIKADAHAHCLQSPDCCQSISLTNRSCYSAQSYATTSALVQRLQLPPDRYTTCFQSRLGKDPWMQPYTSEILKERAAKGDKRLLVFSPAFTADCLETIVEVGYEYSEEFKELGGETIDLVPSLNDDPQWAKAILQIISERTPLPLP